MTRSTLNLTLFNRKVDPAPDEEVKKQEAIRDAEKSNRRLYRRSIILGDHRKNKYSSQHASVDIEKKLFSRPLGKTTPILSALSGEQYRDLHVTNCLGGIILEKSVVKTPVAAVVQSKDEFKIYSTRRIYSEQKRSKVFDHELFAHATVKQVGMGVLQVVLEGNEQPSYTIHNIQNLNTRREYGVKHVVKDENKKQVALTRYGVGHSCLLTTTAHDPILMILLAAIATQVDTRA